MDHFDEHIDALIASHLAGESSPEEDAALTAWMAESAGNRRYFGELQKLWAQTAVARPAAPAVDTEAALQRVKHRLQAGRAVPLKGKRMVFWLRLAAAVLLAVAAVWFLRLRQPSVPGPVIAASDTALTETLADGTVLTLDRQSGVALAAGFNTRERRLRLHGKAGFAVAHDTARPFVVEVQDLEVRVVGTVFRVDESADSASVTVTVSEGKVRVSAGGRAVLLGTGMGAVYDRGSGTLRNLETPQNPVPERVLRFDATPLGEVVQEVEKQYGVKITLKNPALHKCLLTARYNNLPAERVLHLIAESFSLRLSKTENGAYVLDGAGCGE